MKLAYLQETKRNSRVLRRPVHNFLVQTRPWVIQPICIAPVIPGDTLKNLLLQARIVTDPLDNPLIGWWAEHYFFYVKLRDLDDRATFEAMMLDPDNTTSSLNEAADYKYYHGHASSVNYTKKCLKRIVEEYFRADGEAWNVATLDTLPAATIGNDRWTDSLVTETEFLASVSPTEELTVGVDDKFTAQEIDDLMKKWEFQRMNGLLQDMTFEDYLSTHGVNVPNEDNLADLYKPELLRFTRNWTYPSNTVNPADGVPSTAASWAITERADKDRFFTEPGFIVGLQVVRPKVYQGNQKSALVDWMSDSKAWLPAMMGGDPYLGFRAHASGSGPVPGSSGAYRWDIRDLMTKGDQFINFDPSGVTNRNLVALPTSALAKRYPASTDADNLYKTKTAGTGKVNADGVVSLSIMSTVRDMSGTV